MQSICRKSAGRTICPLEETVVFIEVRYRLTRLRVKQIVPGSEIGLSARLELRAATASLFSGVNRVCLSPAPVARKSHFQWPWRRPHQHKCRSADARCAIASGNGFESSLGKWMPGGSLIFQREAISKISATNGGKNVIR